MANKNNGNPSYENTGFEKGPDKAFIERYLKIVKKRNQSNKGNKK